MELDTLGGRKTAMFVIISDTDDTFNFLVAIMYTQLFNLLCDKADDFYGGRLPVHVRFILDEFSNIGKIPKFDKLIATIRSREISASIILQAQSQLKAIYKDNADTIVGNCDTMLILGGKEKGTLKELSEILGKETIDLYNTGESRGKEISHSLNYQNLSNNVILPIAGMIITFVLCYELITAITERNNMRDVDVDTFIKYIFKAGVAVFLHTHTFDIVLDIFDVSEWVVNTASASITNDTYVDVISIYNDFKDTLEAMDNGSLLLLFLEVSVVSLAVKAIAILVAVILINRMIEIYLYCSVAPIPFATITNREWGNIGSNYLRSLLSLGFQSFFIMVIVGIYSVLVKQLQFSTSLNDLVVQLGIYSVVLCMALLNTSNISKSIFNAR